MESFFVAQVAMRFYFVIIFNLLICKVNYYFICCATLFYYAEKS